jgi:hypothetical protein
LHNYLTRTAISTIRALAPKRLRSGGLNLRDLVEQETARSGAQDENRVDDLIAAQEAKLARLLDEREAITG